MRIVNIASHSVYEAFQPNGLVDGDSPCAETVLGKVEELLDRMGYDAEAVWSGSGNHYIYALRHRESGRRVDLGMVAAGQGIDLEEAPEAARQALLAAGLDDVVAALDELDRQEVVQIAPWGESDLPSLVIERHGNQGDIMDFHLFSTAREAAAYALGLDPDEVEIAIPLHPRERTPTCRYQQVMDDQELAELAGIDPATLHEDEDDEDNDEGEE